MPKISVIIPVYKVERYLDACVASVAGQTYADLEIILVDDGSPDNCPALCDAWAKKDARIKVIHQKNAGVSAARNVGIEQATGEFLAFADSDDIFEADVLSKAIKAQKKNDADIVIFNFLCTDAENRPLKDPDYTIFKDETINVEQLWDRFFSLDERCVYYALVWNKLYKASLFQSLRFQQGKRHEDMPKNIPRVSPVHIGSLLQGSGYVLKKVHQQYHIEYRHGRWEYQSPDRVHQAQLSYYHEGWH